MKNQGRILRKIRELKGLKLKEAALLIGRSAGWLSEIENGKGNSRLKESEFTRAVTALGGDAYRSSFANWSRDMPTKPLNQTDLLNGAIYKHLRRKAGLTLIQASYVIGISKSHLGNIENGLKIPNSRLEEKILQLYGYSPSSMKNFRTEDQRAENIPVAFKLRILIKHLSSEALERLYKYAAVLSSSPPAADGIHQNPFKGCVAAGGSCGNSTMCAVLI